MDVLQAHLPPPHVVIVVQGRQLAMHRGQQVVVDRRGHVVREHRPFQHRVEVAGPGMEMSRLHHGRERGGQRILMGLILGVELVEGRRADVADRRIEKRRQAAVAQLDHFPLLVRQRAEPHVGISQLAEDQRGRVGRLGLHRQQPLFLVAQGVRLESQDSLEQQLVGVQCGRSQVLVHLLLWDRQNLGPDEARHLIGLGGDLGELAHHALVDAVALVFRHFQMGVDAQAVGRAADVEVELDALGQRLGDRRRVCPGTRRIRRTAFARRRIPSPMPHRSGKDAKIPCVRLFDFAALRQLS